MNDRKRKAMLVMPVIVAPFIVFIFWVLGLVGPAEAKAFHRAGARGINLNLPAAIPTADSSWDKLQFYAQADKDSAKLRQLRRQDPYLNEGKYGAKAKYQPYPDEALNEADEQEKKVYEKIGEIHRQLEARPAGKKKIVRGEAVTGFNKNNDVDRLERMMQMMNNREPEDDPEIVQIRQLMDSIKDIQHPERVSERMKKEEIRPKVYDVALTAEPISPVSIQGNRFYSMDDSRSEVTVQPIAAVVHEEQKVSTGDLIKLRLSQNVFVNNVQVPENNFVYGVAKVNGNRILVHVSFMQSGPQHFAVSLDVLGQDGMPGIPVQASKAAMAAAQTADRSAQGVNILSVDHSLGAQVAGAAIQTGKQLLKKQTKVVRYTIPPGYEVQLVSGVN